MGSGWKGRAVAHMHGQVFFRQTLCGDMVKQMPPPSRLPSPPPPFPRTPSLLMGVGADTVAVVKEMEAALKNVAADDKVRWQ